MAEMNLMPLGEQEKGEILPAPVAEYANEVFRSRFILELGKGFTFIGNQHILPFNGKEYKVDMLFFHRGLHRMIAIDLKVGEFKPEYIGKMNYYLTLLNRIEKAPDEEPSIDKTLP